MERELEVILEENEETMDLSSMSKDSFGEEMLNETGDKTETDDTTDGMGENIVFDKDETKIKNIVEERDIGERMTDEGNIVNNAERRIVRWRNVEGSSEDGCSSCSIGGISKDTDPENPPLSPIRLVTRGTDQETEPLGLLESCKAAFNWDDFFYSLILGFLPTAWDVFSDLRIASVLKEEVNVEAAGLSYIFVCLPGTTLLFNLFFSTRLAKNCSNGVAIVVFFILFTFTAGALILCFLSNPLLLKYPSIVLGIFVVGIKGVCVFVHTPEMKEFSTKVSVQEYSWESSLQFLLLLHIWINGGPLFISPILSSVLIIGKVSTEFYLISEPENLLENKSFLEKLKLVAKHLPVFTLTAFFRLSTATITNINNPFPTVFFFICVFTMSFVYFVLTSLAFVGLKFCFPILLKDLSLAEATQYIIPEFTTITPWGRLFKLTRLRGSRFVDRLGRRASRGLQMGMATATLLINFGLTAVVYLQVV